MGSTLLLVLSAVLAPQATGDTLVVHVSSITAPTLEVTEELRVGSLDGAPEESFGYVSAVAVDAAGRLYVADLQAAALRVFDRNGRYLRSIGSKGQGPGELQQLQGVAVLGDSVVATWDPASFRVSLFSLDGDFRRSFPVEMRIITGGPSSPFFGLDDGGVLIRTAREIPPGEGAQEIWPAWLHYDPHGTFVDSVIPPRRNVAGVPAAFVIETASVPDRSARLITGRNDDYRLSYPLADGRIARIVSDHEPVAVQPDEAEQWGAYVAVWDERMEYHSPGIPAEKPVWKSLFVDEDHRIWVERYATAKRDPAYRDTRMESFGWPPMEWRQPEALDVLDPRGRVLGKVRLPVGARLLAARGDRLWTLEQGSFDENYVVRYRMSEGR